MRRREEERKMNNDIIYLTLNEFWERYPECEIGIDVHDWTTRRLKNSEHDPEKEIYNRKLKFFKSELEMMEPDKYKIIYIDHNELREQVPDLVKLEF